jgi:thiamine-phosphate pyrophosphorylase
LRLANRYNAIMTPVSHSHVSQGWTAGAQRALTRAAQMASAHAARKVEPIHLLWSLVFDDGHAGVRLEAHGLSRESVAGESPLLGFLQEIATRFEAAECSLPWGPAAAEITAAALQQAFEQKPHSEAGTDHLLWSLCRESSPLAELLQGFGLGPSLWETLSETSTLNDDSPVAIADELQLRAREPTAANPVELFRILDAAANRAREGLRVIEDYARFALDDAFLARLTKECRHELAAALSAFPQAELLASRDTPGDVGTHVATAAEYQRANLTAVLTAACKRTEEALRTLEEFSKVVHGPLGGQFERLRYRLYTVEKAVLRTQFNRERLAEQRLYVLVTEELCPRGSGPVVHAAIQAGMRMFQVREKRMKDRELVERCRWLRQVTREADALLIINDRPDIAAVVDADGVHVGQDEFTVVDARKIVGPEKLVGVSTHNIEQARQAVLDGADYIGVGPTFPSVTKDFTEFAGLAFIRAIADEIGLPWFAIGGITAENIGQVREAGASRVAVCGAVCQAEHPGDAVTELLYRL